MAYIPSLSFSSSSFGTLYSVWSATVNSTNHGTHCHLCNRGRFFHFPDGTEEWNCLYFVSMTPLPKVKKAVCQLVSCLTAVDLRDCTYLVMSRVVVFKDLEIVFCQRMQSMMISDAYILTLVSNERLIVCGRHCGLVKLIQGCFKRQITVWEEK